MIELYAKSTDNIVELLAEKGIKWGQSRRDLEKKLGIPSDGCPNIGTCKSRCNTRGVKMRDGTDNDCCCWNAAKHKTTYPDKRKECKECEEPCAAIRRLMEE